AAVPPQGTKLLASTRVLRKTSDFLMKSSGEKLSKKCAAPRHQGTPHAAISAQRWLPQRRQFKLLQSLAADPRGEEFDEPRNRESHGRNHLQEDHQQRSPSEHRLRGRPMPGVPRCEPAGADPRAGDSEEGDRLTQRTDCGGSVPGGAPLFSYSEARRRAWAWRRLSGGGELRRPRRAIGRSPSLPPTGWEADAMAPGLMLARR